MANIQEFKLTFLSSIPRTGSVVSFRFSSEKPVEFIPGQFAQLVFDDKNRANKELNKYLSFSSQPADDYIEFTKRLSESSFSQKLKSLKSGDALIIKGPMGNCVFDENLSKIVFLVGGIGITPLISIVAHIVKNQYPTDVKILYSNMTEDDVPFKDQLDQWHDQNKNIEVLYTLVACKPKDTGCFVGMINKDLVLENVEDFKDRTFFVFGPPGMVTAMKNICSDIGCPPDMVKAENFIGY